MRRTRKKHFMYEKLNGMLILMWEMVLGSVSVDRLPQAPKVIYHFFLNLHLKFFFFSSQNLQTTTHHSHLSSILILICCMEIMLHRHFTIDFFLLHILEVNNAIEWQQKSRKGMKNWIFFPF